MPRASLLPTLLVLTVLTASADETDTRQVVDLPGPMREHMLSNMRDHLLAIAQITALLAQSRYEAAAEVAEERLGMSAMQHHGAGPMGRHMPDGMRAVGSAMHRAASRFAIAAGDAEVTGDHAAALSALSAVMSQCVACHNAYRLR